MRVCMVVLPESPWCVRAAKTLASLCVLYSLRIHTSGLVYIPQMGNDEIMDLWMEVLFDEISSFIAYAKSIYLICIRDWWQACMSIWWDYTSSFLSESLSTAFLWCARSERPGETVYLPRLLWVIDVSITDSFVLLIGMHFKYMCFNLRRFYNSSKSKYIMHLKRSFVANNIESKTYYSPLILHSVRVLQKYAFEYTKTSVSLRRFFWVPAKLYILRNIPSIRNLMCHTCIFYSTYADAWMYQGSSCRCYTLLLQLLKVRTAYKLASR